MPIWKMVTHTALLRFFSRFTFHFFNDIDQALNGFDRGVELTLFACIQFYLNDTLEPFAPITTGTPT